MSSLAPQPAEDDLGHIADLLRRGEIISQSLLGGLAEVFIDHLQPSLCVYRQPADGGDAGTRQLLSGQASYLLCDGIPEKQPHLRALVSHLVGLMLEAYGVALVIEIWSGPTPIEPPKTVLPLPARYRIVTEKQGVSRQTVEALERAILALNPQSLTEITVEYLSRAAPEGLPSVLDAEEEARDDVFLIGLEVPPTYRDAQSGKLIPETLRQVTRQLSQGLRQASYAFAHRHSAMRPAHFHELGARALAENVADVDMGLAAVGDTFDLLLQSTPVNAEAAFARFVETGCESVPEFLYRPLIVDHGALKLALFKIPLETIEDPALHHMYSEQRDELDRQITMLADRNTSRFLLESQQVFGVPDARLRDIAIRVLQTAGDDGPAVAESPVKNAHDFARKAEDELSHYRAAWPGLPARVEVRDDIPGVMVSKGHFLVGTNAAVREDRIAPLLHHEIGTHILTYYNGLSQPLSQFHTGMPGYEETQEGLAVLSEYLCGGLGVSRLRMLAARVIAVDSIIAGADFVQTFRLLNKAHSFAERDAFTIAMRVHRGGGLTKDVVYLRGLIALLDHLAEGKPFEDLLLGKITLDYMDVVEELQWRRIISPGPLRPRYLEDPKAQKRLKELPTGADVVRLLEGAPR